MCKMCTRTGTDSNEIGIKTNNASKHEGKMLYEKYKARSTGGKQKTKAGSFVDPLPELRVAWIRAF
jgi:hypothetical protein